MCLCYGAARDSGCRILVCKEGVNQEGGLAQPRPSQQGYENEFLPER